MLQSSKLLSVFKPDTLSGVLTLFNDHNLSYSRTSSGDRSQRTLWSCSHQLKYLGYLKLIGSGYNWCHWSPIRWDPCGALNLDVQDVYANGCTVNGTVHHKSNGCQVQWHRRLPVVSLNHHLKRSKEIITIWETNILGEWNYHLKRSFW